MYIICRDDRGNTSLHAAASGVKVEGTLETVDFLLKEPGAKEVLNQPNSEKERVNYSLLVNIINGTISTYLHRGLQLVLLVYTANMKQSSAC